MEKCTFLSLNFSCFEYFFFVLHTHIRSICARDINFQTLSSIRWIANRSFNSSNQEKCHLEVSFPKAGVEWRLGKERGALLRLVMEATLSSEKYSSWTTLLPCWILGWHYPSTNKSQGKERSWGKTGEEEGCFQMQFEIRACVDEARTYRMTIPGDRRCRRCHGIFVFCKGEKRLKRQELQPLH